MKKVLIVGKFHSWSLESSYYSHLLKYYNVLKFDININILKYIKYKQVGNIIHKFFPVESWIKKNNKDLFVYSKNVQPDFIFIFGTSQVTPGTIAQIKSSQKNVKIILFWLDPLLNFTNCLFNSLPLFDYIFTYSRANIEILDMYKRNNVFFLPFACDPNLHFNPPINNNYISDLSFVGMMRPERAEDIYQIIKNFPNKIIKIWGPDWNRDKRFKKFHHTRDLRGVEYASVFKSSIINLNRIDDANYPSANMRFFEIPCAFGGIQLCSNCPEMQDIFLEYETLLYYYNNNDLMNKIDFIFSNPDKLKKISKDANNFVIEYHTYANRVQYINSIILN